MNISDGVFMIIPKYIFYIFYPDFIYKNIRELSQPQERFAPKFKRNQLIFFDFFRSSSF